MVLIDAPSDCSEDDYKANACKTIISAHRTLFRLMFHVPLDVPSDDFQTAINLVFDLVMIGDAYDCLDLLTCHIENHFARCYETNIAELSQNNYQNLLYIATKIHSKWLFRQIVCRIIPDPRDQIPISKYFSEFDMDAVSSLVTDKRDELSASMENIDRRLMMLTPPKGTVFVRDRPTKNCVIAAFRNSLYEHLHSYDPKVSPRNATMRSSYKKYKTLKDSLLTCSRCFTYKGRRTNWSETPHYDKFKYQFGHPNVKSSEFERAFHLLQNRAMDIINPLLKDVVNPPLRKFKDRYDRSLLCIDITESELPWVHDTKPIGGGQLFGEFS